MKLGWYIILGFFAFACADNNGGDGMSIERGFYHWRQKLSLSNDQRKMLQDLDVECLYVKYFDLDWKNEAVVPVSVLDCPEKIDINVVPTVYITTAVFEHIDSSGVEQLLRQTDDLLNDIEVSKHKVKEVQFDCDWTPGIRDKYFYFLSLFKERHKELMVSSTVRLYQYKYPDIAGVPPVDKGLLMYYNMGELMDYDETNSILNNEIGKQYLGYNEYPLPIDLALPNFKWSLLYRGGDFQQICPDVTESLLKNNDLFSLRKNNKYIFKKDTVLFDTYFRFGDELRYESCELEQLLAAAELLKKEINQNTTRVLIYDLQPNTTEEYEKISTVFDAFE